MISSCLTIATLLLAPSFACVAQKKAVGLQLYSLRVDLPKDLKGTIEKVGKAGFSQVETYGFSI